MLWLTEMACGVHLGILLICLVQAEHVRCLWATQAQSSQRQNGNKYVGFSQQDSGPGRLGSSYPQNQLRQASAQSNSFNTATAGSSAYSKGLSSSSYTRTLSQPAKSGSASVKLVQNSSLFKPDSQLSTSSKENPKNAPRKFSGLSTAIASGSSVSHYNKNRRQQGTQRASKYVSSSSASVQSSLSTGKSASHQSAAQKAPAAAPTPAFYGQRGYSPVKSSSLFSAGAPLPQKGPVRMQTSATGLARRVSKTSKPSHFTSLQNERTRNDPSQTEAGKLHGSKLFPGSSKPAPMSSMVSDYASYSQSLPKKQNVPVGFQPHSQKMPTSQRSTYNPSHNSAEQHTSSTSSVQASWNSRNRAQGARNLPASESSRTGTSGKRYAPTKTYNIPPRYGGFAIRRLKTPDEQKLTIPKPQKTYTPPRQTYPAPTQKSYTPSWQKYPAPTQKPYTPSWQKYPAPTQKPYTPSWQKYPAPSQKPYAPSWQKYPAPSQQSESLKPHVPRVHAKSKWITIRPHKKL